MDEGEEGKTRHEKMRSFRGPKHSKSFILSLIVFKELLESKKKIFFLRIKNKFLKIKFLKTILLEKFFSLMTKTY